MKFIHRYPAIPASVAKPLPRFPFPRRVAGIVLLALGLACLSLPLTSRACGPGDGGPTACGDGVASQGNISGTDQGAGNPINIITGNKYQRETDLPALPGVLGLEIVRHYNSAHSMAGSPNGSIGRGWRLSYETELQAIGNTLQVIQADGTRAIFTRDAANPSLCAGRNPANGRMQIQTTARGEEFTWTWITGRKLFFDSRGKLTQILAPSGEFVSLRHDAEGRLLQVTDPQGRSLNLHYLDRDRAARREQFGGVQAIDTPVGRFSYAYGSELPQGSAIDKKILLANLVQVTYPRPAGPAAPAAASGRQYFYEDARHPTLLTGISGFGVGDDAKPARTRLATWAYDGDGKAVMSARGEPLRRTADGVPVAGTGIEQVSIDRRIAGMTVLTNSLDQKTYYRHAVIGSEFRLTEVRGAGCASCGETNVKYAYDTLGRLTETTRLDRRGRTIAGRKAELDDLGRPTRVSATAYRNGKPREKRLLIRYEYEGDNPEPVLIARPSVVAGREAVIRIRYNDAHQVLEIAENGWSPAVDAGKPASGIARTTGYGYRQINGRSLLSEIRGPLHAGPSAGTENTDLTRVEWDGAGNAIVRWIEPGNVSSRIDYDQVTGRLVRVTDGEGYATGFSYDPLGHLVQIGDAAPGQASQQISRIKFDDFGHPVERGSGNADNYWPQMRQSFDGAGRLLWQASAIGVFRHYRYDSESRLTGAGRAGGGVEQTQRYAYDPLHGGMLELADSRGALLRIKRDALGRAEYATDGLGRTRAVAAASGTGRGAGIRRLVDDFGREVATINPDAGTTTRQFDAADRLVGSIDAQGNRAVYEYDAAGRIVRQAVSGKRSGRVSETVWRYRGKRLVAIDHSTQGEQYEYDDRGRLRTRTVKIKRGDGSEITSVTRHEYGDDGELRSISLPDGSRVAYKRDGQGQITALTRSRIRTGWLQWLLPEENLVSDLKRDVVGLAHYRAGNGIAADFQRSRAGVLARVVYRREAPQSKALLANLSDTVITAAGAGEMAAQPTSVSPPGALGLPQDSNALLDLRYLWDAQGNLLHLQEFAGARIVRNYAYDRDDRLIIATESDRNTAEISRYFYDHEGRRLLSQEGEFAQNELAANTERAQYQRETHRWLGDRESAGQYDANGQPERIGARAYRWDALGRLAEVQEQGKPLARYAYNHRGERVAKDAAKFTYFLYHENKLLAELDGKGKLVRQYAYLGNQPIVAIDSPHGKALESAADGVIERVAGDLSTVLRAWFADDEKVVWLHANHLGAIEAATGQDGKPVWRASYHPSGRARVISRGFELNLRLPGQYEDAESGLHYNGRRYYDPRRGAYLTPDPLGAPDGPNPYAYARSNPLRHVDPSGLVLFAFDGTENSVPVLYPGDTQTNVVEFKDLYLSDHKKYRYISGVATVDRSDPARPIYAPFLDAGVNWSGPERISRMVEYFGNEADLVDDNILMEVDIIGFSRGAAQARDFANRIVANTNMIGGTNTGWYSYTVEGTNGNNVKRCQKVDFRFMGLWDTVLSDNWSLYSYQLVIPPEFSYVAQAVALNEYRRHTLPLGRANPLDPHSWGGFPLESIMGDAIGANQTRIERGFLGAHADIGGGFPDNQLSKVALAWMIEQAVRAGVKMDTTPIPVGTDPVLHDKSDVIRFGSPITGTQISNDRVYKPNEDYEIPGNASLGTGAEDRIVRYMGGSTTTQRQMLGAGMSYGDTEQFITYVPERSRSDYITGTVSIDGYVAWLKLNGYSLDYLSLH